MKKLKLLLITIFVLANFSSTILVFAEEEDPPAEPPTSTTLSVFTQTSSGERVSDINIEVSGPDYRQTKSTNTQGTAVFTITQEGNYSVQINIQSNPNFELLSTEVNTKSIEMTLDNAKSIYFGVKRKTVDEADDEEENTSIQLPKIFLGEDSETTILEEKTTDQLKSINELTLHNVGVSKIRFKNKIDLSGEDTITRMNKLDQYVFMQNKGEVTIASDLMPELNLPATITFYNLNFVQLDKDYTPMILKDEQEADLSVTDVSLSNGNTITFDVRGFSSYAIRPTLKFDSKEIETNEQTYLLNGKIDDLDSELTIFINDEKQDLETQINSDGSFEIMVPIIQKETIVQVLAVGVAEQTYSEVVKITNPTIDQQETKDNDEEGIDFTLMAIIITGVLLTMGVTGYLYYKKYYLSKRTPRSIQKNTSPKYDPRLLTQEEKMALEEDKPQASEKPGKNPKNETQTQKDTTPKKAKQIDQTQKEEVLDEEEPTPTL